MMADEAPASTMRMESATATVSSRKKEVSVLVEAVLSVLKDKQGPSDPPTPSTASASTWNSRLEEEHREKELKDSVVATQKRYKFIHEEELRLENLADGVLNSFVTQVTIFQTSTIAIFSLMVGQEIACSVAALVVALVFGLFFGLLFPLFVIYYKLNHLEVWVSDIVLHKSEVDAEAARVIKQFNELQLLIKSNSDLRMFTSSQPNDENQQPESDGEIHPADVEAKQDAGIAGASTPTEIAGASQQPACPPEIGGASQQQPACPPEIDGASQQQPACPPHSLLREHVASLIRMKEEGLHMVHYKKLYGRLLTVSFASAVVYVVVLPIILVFTNKSCKDNWKKKKFGNVFESYLL